MRRKVTALIAVAAAAAVWSGVAQAGYAVGPPSGATTSAQPTFTVFLEPQEQPLARVWVAADTQMDSHYIPVRDLGSCVPSTPTSAQYTLSCQPSSYSNNGFSASLPPGTYYWWVTFYRTDPGSLFQTLHISGPLSFTVPAPIPPSGVSLVSPADGAVVGVTPTLAVAAPAAATVTFYASLSNARLSDGSPVSGSAFSCSGTTTNADTYTCQSNAGDLIAGETYYWWVLIGIGGTNWIYGPRSFTVQAPSGGGGSGGSGGSGGTTAHSLADAPRLPRAAQFTGASIKETRLSTAAYALTKVIGAPKTIAIACWSDSDWRLVSDEVGFSDAGYSLLGFYVDFMPHWVELSPDVCRAIETLIHHRPLYPNRFTANAVETLTHEMMHAIGITRARYGITAEPLAECFGMQLSILLALDLGVPYRYADGLAKYNLLNYATRPSSYRNTSKCRENGAWDIFPNHNSPPWHTYQP